MVTKKHGKCAKCDKQPRYAFPGETMRLCGDHKEDGMIDRSHRRCEKCHRQPNYSLPGERAKLCGDHKEDGMIDVTHKRCEKCARHPTFAYVGERARLCRDHKEDGMIDVKNKRCEKCDNRAIFGLTGGKARLCDDHKEHGMINVVYTMCPGYNVECPVRNQVGRSNKYCMSCDPDDRRRKRFKRLEDAFFDYVVGKIDIYKREFCVSFDHTETSKKCARIDGVVIGDGVIVCVEVDENGHKDYECDEHRMHLVNGELLQLYPDHNIAWVRVNPSTKATKTRNDRFDDVIKTINCILQTRKTEVVYIGFS